MTETEQGLSKIAEWLAQKGIRPMSPEELVRDAGPYMRLGWAPNSSEGLRYLATAIQAVGRANDAP